MLRHFNFESSLKLCCAREVFESQLSVTTGEFELQISCIQVL